jgi:hypothetical protein
MGEAETTNATKGPVQVREEEDNNISLTLPNNIVRWGSNRYLLIRRQIILDSNLKKKALQFV